MLNEPSEHSRSALRDLSKKNRKGLLDTVPRCASCNCSDRSSRRSEVALWALITKPCLSFFGLIRR